MLEEGDDLSVLQEIDDLSTDEIDQFIENVEYLLGSLPELSPPQFPMHSLNADDDFHVISLDVDDGRSTVADSEISDLSVSAPPSPPAGLSACADPGNLILESSSRTYAANVSYYLPYCYGYKQFPGDDENDCFIRFNMNGGKSHYYYRTTNFWADQAADYYEDDGEVIAAYRDGAGHAYLRLGSEWCSVLGAEDGFVIR